MLRTSLGMLQRPPGKCAFSPLSSHFLLTGTTPVFPRAGLPRDAGIRTCRVDRGPYVPQQRYTLSITKHHMKLILWMIGDLSDREGYDFYQMKGIAKVQVSSFYQLHRAFHELSSCIVAVRNGPARSRVRPPGGHAMIAVLFLKQSPVDRNEGDHRDLLEI